MKQPTFYYKEAPLFKAIKYPPGQNKDYQNQTFIIIGFRGQIVYNITISDTSGYMRPNYSLPVADLVQEVKDFDYKRIISFIFEERLDSRWQEIFKYIGEDDRK